MSRTNDKQSSETSIESDADNSLLEDKIVNRLANIMKNIFNIPDQVAPVASATLQGFQVPPPSHQPAPPLSHQPAPPLSHQTILPTSTSYQVPPTFSFNLRPTNPYPPIPSSYLSNYQLPSHHHSINQDQLHPSSISYQTHLSNPYQSNFPQYHQTLSTFQAHQNPHQLHYPPPFPSTLPHDYQTLSSSPPYQPTTTSYHLPQPSRNLPQQSQPTPPYYYQTQQQVPPPPYYYQTQPR